MKPVLAESPERDSANGAGSSPRDLVGTNGNPLHKIIRVNTSIHYFVPIDIWRIRSFNNPVLLSPVEGGRGMTALLKRELFLKKADHEKTSKQVCPSGVSSKGLCVNGARSSPRDLAGAKYERTHSITSMI